MWPYSTTKMYAILSLVLPNLTSMTLHQLVWHWRFQYLIHVAYSPLLWPGPYFGQGPRHTNSRDCGVFAWSELLIYIQYNLLFCVSWTLPFPHSMLGACCSTNPCSSHRFVFWDAIGNPASLSCAWLRGLDVDGTYILSCANSCQLYS